MIAASQERRGKPWREGEASQKISEELQGKGSLPKQQELRETRGNSSKDWGTLGKSAKFHIRLGSSSDNMKAPGTKNFYGEHYKHIAKALQKGDDSKKAGGAVGKLGDTWRASPKLRAHHSLSLELPYITGAVYIALTLSNCSHQCIIVQCI